MAYTIYFAAVDEAQIARFQASEIDQLIPVRIADASHIAPICFDEGELRQLVLDAFDAGEILRTDLWHPCRVPMFHRAESVPRLASVLTARIEALISSLEDDSSKDDYRAEFGGFLSLFNEAAQAGLAVASTLSLPYDRERADRIVIPFAFKDERRPEDIHEGPIVAPPTADKSSWWRRLKRLWE